MRARGRLVLLLALALGGCQHEEVGVRSMAFALEPVGSGGSGAVAIDVHGDSGSVIARGLADPGLDQQLIVTLGFAASDRDALEGKTLEHVIAGVMAWNASDGAWHLSFSSGNVGERSLGAVRTAAVRLGTFSQGVQATALLVGDARDAQAGGAPAPSPSGGGHVH